MVTRLIADTRGFIRDVMHDVQMDTLIADAQTFISDLRARVGQRIDTSAVTSLVARASARRDAGHGSRGARRARPMLRALRASLPKVTLSNGRPAEHRAESPLMSDPARWRSSHAHAETASSSVALPGPGRGRCDRVAARRRGRERGCVADPRPPRPSLLARHSCPRPSRCPRSAPTGQPSNRRVPTRRRRRTGPWSGWSRSATPARPAGTAASKVRRRRCRRPDGAGVAVQSTDYVAPGQVGWFIVHFKARAELGTYTVQLLPRIDGRRAAAGARHLHGRHGRQEPLASRHATRFHRSHAPAVRARGGACRRARDRRPSVDSRFGDRRVRDTDTVSGRAVHDEHAALPTPSLTALPASPAPARPRAPARHCG